MDRQPLLTMLSAYRVAHPDEEAVVDRISALADAHPDCFERTCRPGHLTGSAWVVSADGERHLLMLHRKLGKWLQPGGHADGQANMEGVARREAEEETGLTGLETIASGRGLLPLDVDVHDIPARLAPDGTLIDDAHEHHDIRFLLRVTGSDALVVNEESHELRWCLRDEVRTLTSEPSVLRLLDKAERRLAAAQLTDRDTSSAATE